MHFGAIVITTHDDARFAVFDADLSSHCAYAMCRRCCYLTAYHPHAKVDQRVPQLTF